jgi:hypothetical protein
MFFPLFGNFGVFAEHRTSLEKELKKGSYSLEAFYVARCLLLIPLGLIWPWFWFTGVYWLSNANPAFATYVIAQLLLFLSYITYEGVGQTISASGLSFPQANTLGMILITYWFGWCGFFMDARVLPSWLAWGPHGNSLMYSVQLMMHVLVSDDLRFSCQGLGDGSDLGQDACSGADDWITGAQAKSIYGIDRPPALCLAVLLISLFFFRILAYIFLRSSLQGVIHGVHGARRADAGRAQAEHSLVESKGVTVALDPEIPV